MCVGDIELTGFMGSERFVHSQSCAALSHRLLDISTSSETNRVLRAPWFVGSCVWTGPLVCGLMCLPAFSLSWRLTGAVAHVGFLPFCCSTSPMWTDLVLLIHAFPLRGF